MKKSRKISFRLVSIWTICDKWSRQDPSHKKCTRVWTGSGAGHSNCYWQRLGLATLAPTSVWWLRHPRVTARWGFRLILSGCQEIVRAWLIKWLHLTVQLRHSVQQEFFWNTFFQHRFIQWMCLACCLLCYSYEYQNCPGNWKLIINLLKCSSLLCCIDKRVLVHS